MMAQAVIATKPGGPEVLSLIETSVDSPGPGQVLLDVKAAGTNPVDLKSYSGSGPQPQFPIRLGMEAAGVVRAIGPDAVGADGPIEIGDEVIAFRVSGAYATELVVPASAVVRKPTAMSFEAAGGLMLTGTTAVHALQAVSARAGETLVVHGAAGGVGLMVVQIAVAAGVRVIGTAGQGAAELLEGLGAEAVAYGDWLADRLSEAAPEGYDAAIDCVGTDEAIETSVNLVRDRSRIATLVAIPRGLELGIKCLGRRQGADPGEEIRAEGRLELVRLVESGDLKVQIVATYPLSEATSAHRRLAEGHTHGKIVLVPERP